jgi:dual-specificity kinase
MYVSHFDTFSGAGTLIASFLDRVVRLLGQGTFGKVVEAIDMAHPLYSVNGGRSHLRPNADYPPNAGRVAIKIIRAVPKYRDASKIEIRVLKRLKESDPQNTRQVHSASRLRHAISSLPIGTASIT